MQISPAEHPNLEFGHLKYPGGLVDMGTCTDTTEFIGDYDRPYKVTYQPTGIMRWDSGILMAHMAILSRATLGRWILV